MKKQVSIGLPSMHVEPGEKRAFLPDFVAVLNRAGAAVVLEHGYGAGMGFSEDDYLSAGSDVRFAGHDEAYAQDYVLVLRCPSDDDLRKLHPGACLISMLHYPTNPHRTKFIHSLGVNAISLDSITDDAGNRLVENMRAVAWNGLEVAFQALRDNYPPLGFDNPQREPIHVTLMGSGRVGMQVVPAAIRYGDIELWQQMIEIGVPGVQLKVIDYDTTGHEEIMLDILAHADMLVDATQRPDPSKPVIPNAWIDVMRAHAVLLDLSVDPYDRADPPSSVKGIEGMPHGNLDHYVFQPDDPQWDATVPTNIPSVHRRTAVTCYSWPGIHPRACMRHYGQQLEPLMEVLLDGGYDNLSLEGNATQRALFRASLHAQPIFDDAL